MAEKKEPVIAQVVNGLSSEISRHGSVGTANIPVVKLREWRDILAVYLAEEVTKLVAMEKRLADLSERLEKVKPETKH